MKPDPVSFTCPHQDLVLWSGTSLTHQQFMLVYDVHDCQFLFEVNQSQIVTN